MGSGVHSLGYFLFEVSDLDAWDRFLTKVIGAQRGDALGEGLVPYRTDERAARILLRQGPADDLVALGFEVPSEQALHEVITHVREGGHSTSRVPAFPFTTECLASTMDSRLRGNDGSERELGGGGAVAAGCRPHKRYPGVNL